MKVFATTFSNDTRERPILTLYEYDHFTSRILLVLLLGYIRIL